MEFIFSGIVMIIIGFLYLIPILWILFSSKVSGGEKIAWLLLVVFVSWLAWIFFLLLAPLSQKSRLARD